MNENVAHDIVTFAEWTDSATLVVWCKTCHAEIACFHHGAETTVNQLREIADKHTQEREDKA